MTDTLITPDGLAKLNEELEQLTTAGRRQTAERIGHAAASAANVAENADYVDALEDHGRLERRIAILNQRIASAQVVEPDALNGVVDVGERVHLHDIESGERLEYELVGSLEADPFAGRISAASPLGRAVLGRRRGDVVVVDAPKGRLQLKIVGIEPGARPGPVGHHR